METYEAAIVRRAVDSRIMALEEFVRDAGDEEQQKHQLLVKILLITGDPPVDALARLNVDVARREWESAQTQRLEAEQRCKDAVFERENPAKWVAVHSPAGISDSPVGKKADESLGWVIVQAVGAGLAFALAVPYLLELAFPRRVRPRSPAGEAWAGGSAGVQLEEVSTNS